MLGYFIHLRITRHIPQCMLHFVLMPGNENYLRSLFALG
nr:MAG TPA: hypothetical protein [Caudoviricetes sp.]